MLSVFLSKQTLHKYTFRRFQGLQTGRNPGNCDPDNRNPCISYCNLRRELRVRTATPPIVDGQSTRESCWQLTGARCRDAAVAQGTAGYRVCLQPPAGNFASVGYSSATTLNTLGPVPVAEL